MKETDYHKSILVNGNRRQAFEALTTSYGSWWTKPDRPIHQVGDQARFSFPPGKSFWTFRATELISDERVTLTCVEALHLHDALSETIREEWLGTQLHWSIKDHGAQTQIELLHQGLNPKLECFNVCEAGWNFFFLDSLKAYLDTGQGKPHRE